MVKKYGGGFRSCPTINEIIKVYCGASGGAEFFENLWKEGDLMSVRNKEHLVKASSLKKCSNVGGRCNIKYRLLCVNCEWEKHVAKNYEALESKIQELKDELAIYGKGYIE